MTDKAYIVANNEQELDVLNKFERKGLVWITGENPTNFVLSEGAGFNYFPSFPYVLNEGKDISWLSISQLKDEEIIYDGRKEQKMYKVTQEFMNEFIEWRDINNLDALQGNWQNTFRPADFKYFPDVVSHWRLEDENPIERNNRLIAIIQWLNGEDVFEVENPHKFVVRSEHTDQGGHYGYVAAGQSGISYNRYYINEATKFDTREEAQEWANSHQVVVEIDEDGNEVE